MTDPTDTTLRIWRLERRGTWLAEALFWLSGFHGLLCLMSAFGLPILWLVVNGVVWLLVFVAIVLLNHRLTRLEDRL